MTAITNLPAWRDLLAQADATRNVTLNMLFEQAPERAQQLRVQVDGLLLDYSKQRLTPQTREQLVQLAEASAVPEAIAAMFAGKAINTSEGRAAWHVALRAPRDAGFCESVSSEVHGVLDAMASFSEKVRTGSWLGFSGETITDVINIGIGGSDLGPRMVCRALVDAQPDLNVHFVANVDPDELDDVLARINPRRSLFVIASKSFSTTETLANARAAREWLLESGAAQADVAKHFVAVSTNAKAVSEFGIDTDNMFAFWDWVGGRYSLWSAVGLSIVLALGMQAFRELLAGAHSMDRHFQSAPLVDNLPVMLALTGIWNRNFLNMPGLVIAPYAQRLENFPTWLQQLEMESNGKSVTPQGTSAEVDTAPSIWGSVGTNAQHAYFQLLHQGCDIVPVDFILPLGRAVRGRDTRNNERVANCLAQAEALMAGKSKAQVIAQGQNSDQIITDALAAQRGFAGNRPSNMLVLDKLDARNLGALLAAYEHKTYVQGVIWGINSFDQWGVELGKGLARQLMLELAGEATGTHDSSTQALLELAKRHE